MSVLSSLLQVTPRRHPTQGFSCQFAVQDHSGQVELRMREKAALEFSGMDMREMFCEEVRAVGLNFPILASVRVLVRKNSTAAETRPAEASAAEHVIAAILCGGH